jgi:O-antigen biosynthesis protein
MCRSGIRNKNIVVIWNYMTLDCTGERFLPWMDDDVIYFEHIHRYIFALSFVKGKTVLDLACGEGYGSHILAKVAKTVVGIDIDKNTIEHASKKYQTRNLTFIQGSILQIPLNDEKRFDVIVCFEAIEHIENHGKMLSEVKRVLKDDGIFIVSSPDRKLFSGSNTYINPFHKKELYFEEFSDLLKNHFQHYKIFGQYIYSSSNIFAISPSNHPVVKEFVIEKRNEDPFFSETKKKEPRFFIGIAWNNVLNDEFSNSILRNIYGTLKGDKDNHIDNLENIVIDRERKIKDLETIIIGKERKTNDLEKIVIDRERKTNDLEKIVIDRERKIKDLESHIRENEVKIAKFEEVSKSLYHLIRLWMQYKIN